MKPLISSLAAFALLGACATPAAPATDAVTVPMDLSSGRPIVSAMINGQGPFNLIMDTGMPRGGLLSRAVVETLGIEPSGKKRIGSPLGGEPVEADVYTIDRLTLGEAESTNFSVSSILDDPLAGATGDGVIGPSLFDGGPVQFDFAASTLTFNAPLPEDVTWIPLGESAPLLDAVIQLRGIDMPAHIDTGAQHTMSFPESYAETLPLDGPVQVVGRGRTIDMEFEIRGAPLNDTATLGNATIPVSLITFGPLPVVNLGTNGLRGTVLTIDWPNSRFALTGTATPAAMQVRRVQAPPEDAAPTQ